MTDTKRKIESLENEISSLSKGTIVYKTIGGKKHPYLQWNENKKTISKYVKKEELDSLLLKIEKRKDFTQELKSLKKELEEKNSKKPIIFSICSLAIFIALAVPIVFWAKHLLENTEFELTKYLIASGVFIVLMILYIILHELTHGLFYKIYTHEKLTFGFTLTVAFCGIPTIYVKRRPMIVILLAPFVTYTILLTPIIVIFFNNLYVFTASSLLMALHLSGCIGDLFDWILLAFKFRDDSLLINDTGPKQTFYIKE